MPHLFGNYYDAFLPDMPWMTRLNSGREPLFYSIYVGPIVLLLAGAALRVRPAPGGALADRRRLPGVGGHGRATRPAYALARQLLPPLAFFRFPVKYLAVASFALAVPVADAWTAGRRGEPARDSVGWPSSRVRPPRWLAPRSLASAP